MSNFKTVNFFATKNDISMLLSAVESKHSLQYVKCGSFDSQHITILMSGLAIPNLGLALSGDHNHEPFWLIMHRSAVIKTRSVVQRKGGSRMIIDARQNPDSLVFSCGGVFDKCIIDGKFSGCVDSVIAHELMVLFTHHIRQQFARIKSFFVGNEAERMLDAGYRLTISASASRDIDLSKR